MNLNYLLCSLLVCLTSIAVDHHNMQRDLRCMIAATEIAQTLQSNAHHQLFKEYLHEALIVVEQRNKLACHVQTADEIRTLANYDKSLMEFFQAAQKTFVSLNTFQK